MIPQESPLYAECPACKQTVEYIEELSGQTTTCPNCAIEILLPSIQKRRAVHPTRLRIKAGRTQKIIAIAVAAFVLITGTIIVVRSLGAAETAATGGVLLFGIVIFVGGLAVYFLPTIIAGVRSHRNLIAIGVLNAAFGWTLVGWIAAMIWAVYQEKE